LCTSQTHSLYKVKDSAAGSGDGAGDRPILVQSADVSVRNAVRGELEAAGFKRIGTGSFEGQRTRSNLIGALTKALAHATQAEALDHLWVYLDEPDEPSPPEL
jgi:hypothetical protein